MTLLLHQLAGPGGFVLAGLAHFNHRLRGAAADADEAFCRQLAAQLDVQFVAEGADVAAEARRARMSTEATARSLRYAFLERARSQLGADLVAVGHTRDDQAETYLLRLLRGAGPRGLAGIRPARGSIVRPLLAFGREEVHAWLRQTGQGFCTDATNQDLSVPRNRVRHEVLPVLEKAAPGASATIARAAAIASEDERFLVARATEAAARIVLKRDEGQVILRANDLRALDPALSRRIVRDTLSSVAPGRFHGLDHVEAVLDLDRGSLDLPGVLVTLEGEFLSVAARLGRSPERAAKRAESNVFRYSLSIPGEACVPEAGLAISAEIVIGRPLSSDTKDVVAVQASRAGGALSVRNRRLGDRLRPRGLGGSKKLQDYFVDRKVPRAERDRIPLVVDPNDRIIWVVGHGVAEDYRVTAPEEAVLLLKVRHLGDIVELDS